MAQQSTQRINQKIQGGEERERAGPHRPYETKGGKAAEETPRHVLRSRGPLRELQIPKEIERGEAQKEHKARIVGRWAENEGYLGEVR